MSNQELTPEQEARVYVVSVLRRFLKEYCGGYISFEEAIREGNKVTDINNISEEISDKIFSTFVRGILKQPNICLKPGRRKRSPFLDEMCYQLVKSVNKKEKYPITKVTGRYRKTAFKRASEILVELKIPLQETYVIKAYEKHLERMKRNAPLKL